MGSHERELGQADAAAEELSGALAACATLDDALEVLLGRARAATRAEAGTVYLAEGTELFFAAVHNDRVPASLITAAFGYRIPISSSSLAGAVAASGTPLRLDDARTIPEDLPFRFNAAYDKETGYETRSVLAVPMLAPGGVTLGVIELINRLDAAGACAPFRAEDEALVIALARTAAEPIERARGASPGERPMDAATERDLRLELELLTQIGIALSSERSLDRLFELILGEARKIARAEAGTLYVREGDGLRFAVVHNERLADLRAPVGGGAIIPINRTSIAGYVATTGRIVNLPDVYKLPASAELQFNRSFDEKTGYRTRSILAVPLRSPNGTIDGVVQLINARDARGEIAPFDAQLETLCLALASQASVALRNAKLARELERSAQETILRLARAASLREGTGAARIQRIAKLSEAVALALGLPKDEAALLGLAAPLHDVGKLGLPDTLLQKRSGLTEEEQWQLELHTYYGADILAGSDIPLLKLAREVALTHHERWDGLGYPRGLAGKRIPICGRIVAAIDHLDTLLVDGAATLEGGGTAAPVLTVAMPEVAAACATLRERAGTELDPEIVEVVVGKIDELLALRRRAAEEADGLLAAPA